MDLEETQSKLERLQNEYEQDRKAFIDSETENKQLRIACESMTKQKEVLQKALANAKQQVLYYEEAKLNEINQQQSYQHVPTGHGVAGLESV